MEAEMGQRPRTASSAAGLNDGHPLPLPGTEAYEVLPQFPKRYPLPFRRTIRRQELHQIINRSRKPAWLKGFAVIDTGHYRRFYRQKRRTFADEGLRGIGLSSISA
jgi:hypothetical protein